MKQARLRELFAGWITGQLTEAEQAEWWQLLTDAELDDTRRQLIDQYYEQLPIGHLMHPADSETLFRNILTAASQPQASAEPQVSAQPQSPSAHPQTKTRRFTPRTWLAAAAVLFIIITTGILINQKTKETPAVVKTNIFRNDVQPGGNHATLTLANGTTVLLDSADRGSLASQGGSRVIKPEQGKLAYEATSPQATTLYNTLSTPAGGQYQVTLTDGTRVWLNALSSIRYPTVFTGDTREVELSGEAYFEVATNKEKPFYVKAKDLDIQVLGTSFDLNAYTDEPTQKTSLLSGSVKVEKAGQTLILKPGQQAAASSATTNKAAANPLTLVPNADVEEAIAWKNGFFSLEDADVKTVMRLLTRWYGIDVHYEGQPSANTFSGRMGRDLQLTQVLTGLSHNGVHFKLEGKTLTVYP